MLDKQVMREIIEAGIEPSLLPDLLQMYSCAMATAITNKMLCGDKSYVKAVVKKFIKRNKPAYVKESYAFRLWEALNQLSDMQTMRALSGLGGRRAKTVKQVLANTVYSSTPPRRTEK